MIDAVRMDRTAASYITMYRRMQQKVTEHLATDTPWSVKSFRYLGRSDIIALLDKKPEATVTDFVPIAKQIWEILCITRDRSFPGSLILAFQAVVHYPAPSLKQLLKYIGLELSRKFDSLKPRIVVKVSFTKPIAALVPDQGPDLTRLDVGMNYKIQYTRAGPREHGTLFDQLHQKIPDSPNPKKRLVFELQRPNNAPLSRVAVEGQDTYIKTSNKLEFSASASWSVEKLLGSGRRLTVVKATDKLMPNMEADTDMHASRVTVNELQIFAPF